MAVSTAQVGNLSITTQVVPAGENNVPGLVTVPSTQNWAQVLSQKKKLPIKSLSAVIILIGTLQLCIAVSMYIADNNYLSLLSRSRVYILSLVFISTGILTVVFASEESIVKIQTCLVSHAINALSAAIGMVLYAIQIYTDSQACWQAINNSEHSRCAPTVPNGTSTYEPYHHYYSWDYGEYVYTLRLSLNSLVLFYIFVAFIISICIILFRWKLLQKTKYTLLVN
ncbi:hypothetical protein GDO78_010369 [Eleutherodactylus coqui]|uniref:Uncharacterized protein n=1 Tax=Eleutherodactylus coqui TaxID=57060 RepID=A0A8J6K5Y8_ELECQ|nr:hypothetical protein GDO78_010369 [Eleutherodactylus coqui]